MIYFIIVKLAVHFPKGRSLDSGLYLALEWSSWRFADTANKMNEYIIWASTWEKGPKASFWAKWVFHPIWISNIWGFQICKNFGNQTILSAWIRLLSTPSSLRCQWRYMIFSWRHYFSGAADLSFYSQIGTTCELHSNGTTVYFLVSN